MSDKDDENGSIDDQRPSPGASDPGEAGYDQEVGVGDDAYEGQFQPEPEAEEQQDT